MIRTSSCLKLEHGQIGGMVGFQVRICRINDDMIEIDLGTAVFPKVFYAREIAPEEFALLDSLLQTNDTGSKETPPDNEQKSF